MTVDSKNVETRVVDNDGDGGGGDNTVVDVDDAVLAHEENEVEVRNTIVRGGPDSEGELRI